MPVEGSGEDYILLAQEHEEDLATSYTLRFFLSSMFGYAVCLSLCREHYARPEQKRYADLAGLKASLAKNTFEMRATCLWFYRRTSLDYNC